MTEKAIETYPYDVLRLLLYFSSDKGKKLLPSMWQVITSEIVGATHEYLSGEEFLHTYFKYGQCPLTDWELIVNKTLEKLFENRSEKIHTHLAETLKYLLLFQFKTDHGESWHDNPIRYCFLFGGYNLGSSTMELSVIDVSYTEKKVLPFIDQDTVEHCQKIAEIMKKYIGKDLEYIRNRYRY